MNEKGVVISEFTWSGDYNNFYNGLGMFYIANLEYLGLQRAATAKECVEVMGALAEQYGYIDGGECLLVADQNEVWIFEICGPGPLWTKDSGKPGAHWAARRVPDDKVFVGANRSRLGVLDFNDPDTLISTDITVWPSELGLWKEGEEFNFTNIFNPNPYGYMFYASRREWRAFSLIAPSQEFPVVDRWNHYDFAITPDEPVSKELIMRDIYSDHLEGTPYSTTEGAAAGPFGNPHRLQVPGSMKPETGEDWERIIAQFRCTYSFVAELRQDMPGELGSVLWFGEDSPDTTVYVPIYAGTTEVPVEWATGNRKAFDENCAWWAFNFVNNYAALGWNVMYPEIAAKRDEMEAKFISEIPGVDAEALKLYNAGDVEGAKAVLTKYVNDTMNYTYNEWWGFAKYLVGRFYDGTIYDAVNKSSSNFGYSTEYLEAVDYGHTHMNQWLAIPGNAPAEEPAETEAPATEAPATEAPATEAPATEAPAAAPAANNGIGSLILGIVIGAAAAVVFFLLKKKK
jgi:dipeptidase